MIRADYLQEGTRVRKDPIDHGLLILPRETFAALGRTMRKPQLWDLIAKLRGAMWAQMIALRPE